MMGWEIHITRKQHWHDEHGPRISFEEWQAHLVTDASVIRDAMNGEHDFLMVLEDGNECPLWYNLDRGELHTKNPSDTAIKKAKALARALRAQVLDDDDVPC